MRLRTRSAARPVARLALAALSLLVGSGCGYSVVRYQGAIPEAETLAIRTLENDTYEPGVEALVVDALRREAIERGGLRLVEDPTQADLVMSGRVASLVVNARSFSSISLSLEYEVRMRLALKVQRRDGAPVPLDGRALTERETYLASADVEAMRKNRRETIHRLAEVLADRVYDSLYESTTQ